MQVLFQITFWTIPLKNIRSPFLRPQKSQLGASWKQSDPFVAGPSKTTVDGQSTDGAKFTSTCPAINKVQGKPKNWAFLRQSQGPSPDMKLEFFPNLHKGKRAAVEIDEDHMFTVTGTTI